MTPTLKTWSSQIPDALVKSLDEHRDAVEAWFDLKWRAVQAPLYCSVDLRNAGFKLAPVDTNLFPAGFNNLSGPARERAVKAMSEAILTRVPEASRILLVPETLTGQIFYFENIAVLMECIEAAGFEIRLGSLAEGLTSMRTITLPSGKKIDVHPVVHENDLLSVDNFMPDMIILNNDLSGGVAKELESIKQPIEPDLSLGWYQRLKSSHFKIYQDVVEEFSKEIGCDPWLMMPLFRYCGEVDFMAREGEDCLIKHVTGLLKSIREKYEVYDIQEQPFVVVKADAGTYGLAIMMVSDPEELRQLNRKQRQRMSKIKGGRAVTNVIIQEGVHSVERAHDQNAAAESVMYMIDRYIVGGFYRFHTGKGAVDSLNAPGMQFEAMEEGGDDFHFYPYSVVARLALLAAAYERQ